MYKFIPTKDITAYELALITRSMMVALIQGVSGRKPDGLEDLDIEDELVSSLPENIRIHFQKE